MAESKPLRGANIGHVGLRVMVMAHGVRLTWLQRTVLVAIASHANEYGKKCYPTLALLAGETDLTERSVRAAVKELEQLGVLAVEHRRGWNQPNSYVIHADALAGLPRIAVAADANDGEGSEAGARGIGSSRGDGSEAHGGLTVQKAQKNGNPPYPPEGGARDITADDVRSGGRTVATAGRNGNGHRTGGIEDPALWLDRYNLRMETDLRSDDPANLRAIRRTIAKGYTIADADRVLTWVAATWRDAPRLPNTILGQKFGQYLAEAKRPTRGADSERRVNAKWGQPTPRLVVQRDDA